MTHSRVLEIRTLTAGYRPRPVITNLSLPDLPSGRVIAFVGPNAAGKSTLLRVLAGLLSATGSVRFDGVELLSLSPARRAGIVSYLPQSLPYGVSLSAIDSVIAAFRASPIAGIQSGLASRRAMAMLDRLGIADIALEYLDRLSGGQRQLVGLAQALVRDPKLLLLDEPTSALDLRHQIAVMSNLRALAAEGRTVIVVLHDLNLAARWSDFVVVLDQGTVIAATNPADALKPEIIAAVYGVAVRVDLSKDGRPNIVVEGALPTAPSSEA